MFNSVSKYYLFTKKNNVIIICLMIYHLIKSKTNECKQNLHLRLRKEFYDFQINHET